MPWTTYHWLILGLLCVIALQAVVIVHLLDRPRRRTPTRTVYLPSARRSRRWKAGQYIADSGNDWRRVGDDMRKVIGSEES